MSRLLADLTPEEEARIEAQLEADNRRRVAELTGTADIVPEAGELHEEIPWTDEDEADTRAIMDVLGPRWERQERQARRERMRAHVINPEVERGGNGAGA